MLGVRVEGREDTLSVKSLREDFDDFKDELDRALQGDPRVPEHVGIWTKLGKMDGRISSLEDSEKARSIREETDKKIRAAFIAGLTALGVLSAGLVLVLGYVFRVVLGAA